MHVYLCAEGRPSEWQSSLWQFDDNLHCPMTISIQKHIFTSEKYLRTIPCQFSARIPSDRLGPQSTGAELFGDFFWGTVWGFFFGFLAAFNLQQLEAITLHFALYLHDLGSKFGQITSNFHPVLCICLVFAAFGS